MTTALRLAIGLPAALTLAGLVGCDKTDATSATPASSGTGMTGMGPGANVTSTAFPHDGQGVGGAPTFGETTGTGFPSGDAAHGGSSGSGLEGYNKTGNNGTSAAVSDTHEVGAPAAKAPAPVLPEP